MRIVGDNTALVSGRQDLAPDRAAGPAETQGEAFPFGTRGLVPVWTERRKKGGFKTVYAFPCSDGAVTGDDGLAEELGRALAFLDGLVAEAAGLSGVDLGALGDVRAGVEASGYRFTRVEEHWDDPQASSPVHLRVEAGLADGAPGELSAVIEYDADGRVRHVLVDQRTPDGRACEVTAAVDFDDGRLAVERVTERRPDEERPFVAYLWHRRPARRF